MVRKRYFLEQIEKRRKEKREEQIYPIFYCLPNTRIMRSFSLWTVNSSRNIFFYDININTICILLHIVPETARLTTGPQLISLLVLKVGLKNEHLILHTYILCLYPEWKAKRDLLIIHTLSLYFSVFLLFDMMLKPFPHPGCNPSFFWLSSQFY